MLESRHNFSSCLTRALLKYADKMVIFVICKLLQLLTLSDLQNIDNLCKKCTILYDSNFQPPKNFIVTGMAGHTNCM